MEKVIDMRTFADALKGTKNGTKMHIMPIKKQRQTDTQTGRQTDKLTLSFFELCRVSYGFDHKGNIGVV